MKISEKIRRLRMDNGLTTREFGKIAQVSRQAVEAWESGTRSPKVGSIMKLCTHFDIDLHDFIDEANDIYKKTPTSDNRDGRQTDPKEQVMGELTKIMRQLPLEALQLGLGYFQLLYDMQNSAHGSQNPDSPAHD